MLKSAAPPNLGNDSPFVTTLIASIQAEETAIDQVIFAVDSNNEAAVMAAARELAAIRRGCTTGNCVE